MRALAEVGVDSLLLSYDMIDGASLDKVSDESVDDELLRAIWEQVAVLRRHRIAHRDLRRANLFVDAAGAPWVIDFGFSEVAASDDLLDADVAQLLASLAVKVGAARAVASAVEVLGRDGVGSCLHRLQMGALSGATQEALKEHKGLLHEVQQEVMTRCGIEQPEYEQLSRVNGKTVFSLVMLAAVTYFLLPQLADVPGIFGEIRNADWTYLPAIIVGSAVTYFGAGLSMLGSVPNRLAFRPTVVTQVASSFVGRLAPSSVGGMALNGRFLQKSGVDPAVAASGVGLNTMGGLVMHVLLLVLFAVWAGNDAFGSFDLPDPHIFLYGVAVVVGIAVAAFAIPAVRRAVFGKVVPLLRKAVGGVAGVLRRPDKLAMLLGGSTIVTLSYIVSVYLSTLAFGGDLRFAQVGAIYLAGSAIAVAAPTPGGLGALEAALIAGFTAAGMDKDIAVPAVFLYRLCTYWLPILPGWLGFSWLRRREYV
jgi:undecaprenyl-diphosphatase